MYRYRELNPDEVLPDEQKIADLTVRILSVGLGIKRPVLRFMEPSHFGEVTSHAAVVGLLRASVVYVRANQAPMDLIRTIAHEVRHWEQQECVGLNWAHQMRERDAQIFELEFAHRFRGQTHVEILDQLRKIPMTIGTFD